MVLFILRGKRNRQTTAFVRSPRAVTIADNADGLEDGSMSAEPVAPSQSRP
jgi:hypothetical protein